MDSVEIEIIPSTKAALVAGNLQFRSVTDFGTTAEDLKKACLDLGDEVFLFRTDDSYLLRYLRYTRFNCDEAYNSIRKLYSLRMRNPELFSLPSNFETLLKCGFVTYLPYKDQEGRPIAIIDFRKWNTKQMSIGDVFIVVPAIYDIILMNPHAQISGSVAIWDLRGASWRHMAQIMNPSIHISASNIFQDCYPLRTKMVILIHCRPSVRAAYSVLRHLIKKKLQDRIKFLGSDMTELHQYLNPAVLPKEYGGSLEDSEFSTADLILNNLPYLRYERSFGQKTTCKLHPNE